MGGGGVGRWNAVNYSYLGSLMRGKRVVLTQVPRGSVSEIDLVYALTQCTCTRPSGQSKPV